MVLVQQPALQHALGMPVTDGPQQPPGEQIQAEPSPQIAPLSAVGLPAEPNPRRVPP
jgi:hypothetical protein